MAFLFSALVFVVGLSSSVTFASGSAAAPVVKNPNPGSGLVAVYGDSLAVGHGSTDPANTIENCIAKNFSVPTTLVARNGATTDEGVARLDELLKKKPRVVVISLGGNDVLSVIWRKDFPESRTFDNIRKIYRRLTKEGVMVVQLGLDPQIPEASRLPAIQPIAEAEGVLYVHDILEGMWGDDTLLPDGIHPNDVGYQKVCERVTESLKPYYP